MFIKLSTKSTTFKYTYVFAILEWYKLGIRKDFLVHRKRTVESFGYVKADISSINAGMESMKNMLGSVEARISALDSQIAGLSKALDKCAFDIGMQQNHNLDIQSKAENINKLISDVVAAVTAFKSKINNLVSNGQQISKNIAINKNSIKRLSLSSKSQSLKNRQIDSALKKSQKDIKKIKNLLNRKLKSTKRKDLELEAKIKSQRKSVIKLNRKIEGKKLVKPKKRIAKKAIARKATPKKRAVKKTVIKKVTPKKTVTTVKTPKRTVTTTVTPTKKNIVEIVKGKNPLI